MPKKSDRKPLTVIEADIVRADNIQARCFDLVDDEEKYRAFLQARSSSSRTVDTQFQMLDDARRPRIDLLVCKDECHIGVLTKDCRDRISVADSKRGSGFGLHGEFGESWISCGVSDDEYDDNPEPIIMVDDAATEKKWRLYSRG